MNNYQIYEVIGNGRNSTVRKGRRKNTIEYYAIASYDKVQRARVNTSVQFLRTLSHPNVLKFFNWYETGNHLWVITELCTGGNLRTILTEESRLPEVSIRVLAGDIANGLSYLHSRGVLYVELKPSNLLLDATGQLRFYDFGLSIVFSHADKSGRIGAPSFMAPERFEDGGVPSMASDLWSFGCVLYEMAVGAPPFHGDSTKQLISDIVSEPHPPLEGFSSEFTSLVNGLLCKDPATRYTWADVEASGVFSSFVAPKQFPKQPHFDAFLKQKELDRVGGPSGDGMPRNTVSREAQRRDNNVLRASINAERNLNKWKGIRSDQSNYSAAPSPTKGNAGGSDQNGVGEGSNAAAEVTDTAEGTKNEVVSSSTVATKDLRKEDDKKEEANRGGVTITKVIMPTNDTFIDGKVTLLKASVSKAHLDMEMDFRDPDAIDERDGGAAVVAVVVPDHAPVAPTPDDGSNLTEVPSLGGPPTVTAPSAANATPHPQTPLAETRPQRPSNVAGGGAVETVAVEDLMYHPQDPHLRPLVGNNRIERYVEPRVDLVYLQQATGIVPTSALQLRELPREKKDEFLNAIYNAVKPASTPKALPEPSGTVKTTELAVSDKTQLLGYFETLCTDASLAETVVNCSLMTVFTQLLFTPASANARPTSAVTAKNAADASPAREAALVAAHNQFRLQVATVMGLLVRHSNFIDEAVHGATLIPNLIDAFRRETHARVKRRLLASIGELLFYITSRPPLQRASWRIDGASVAEVFASALHDGDDVLVHYAAKMIENTCSVADVSAAALFKFTSQPIVTALLARYDSFMAPVSAAGAGTSAAGATRTNSFLEHLRVALACAALKLCLVDHSLFPLVLTWPTFEPATFLNEVASYGASPNSPITTATTVTAPTGAKHNPKVTQSYLTVIIALFAKTITLNSGTLCGHYTRGMSWAKQQSGSGTCSVFSAAACPSSSGFFSVDAPVLGKIRQTIATLMPRVLKKTFLSHTSSPIRAKSCLVLALLIIADECGLTAPPSRMLLRALAAEPTSTSDGNKSGALSRAVANANTQTNVVIAGGVSNTSMRAVLAHLSRDTADAQVQKCADAVIAVGQIASILSLTALSQGKPLLPPPAPADPLTVALHLDLALHCLSTPLCINISTMYDAPQQLLFTLGRVLHRFASDPSSSEFHQHLEAALQLTEVVAIRAFKQAEQQGSALAAVAAAAKNNRGGSSEAVPIVGDAMLGGAATAGVSVNNAVTAKTREVAKTLLSAIFPALIPTLEGVIARAMSAAATAGKDTSEIAGTRAQEEKTATGSSKSSSNVSAIPPVQPPSAIVGGGSRPLSGHPRPPFMPVPPPTTAGGSFTSNVNASGIPTSLPSQLQPSHPTEMPFVVVNFINSLLGPILGDEEVCGSGDVTNSLYVFGKELVRIAPKLLGLKDIIVASAMPPSVGGGGAKAELAALSVTESEAGESGSYNNNNNKTTAVRSGSVEGGLLPNNSSSPHSAAMVVTITLRVLSSLCDVCPSLTHELRTASFVDNLMPVLKRPPHEINNQVLLLLLRLLKITPETSADVRGSAAAVRASGVSANSSVAASRIGAAASAHNTHTSLDLEIMRHCVTKHQLLQWSMNTALKCLSDWSSLEDIIASLMEVVFLVVYAASQNTSSEMAMVCGHLVAGSDATPVESLLLKICVEHPSAVAAADCASSCVFLLVGLFEEARRLLVRPRVLTQIREVLNKTCFVMSVDEMEWASSAGAVTRPSSSEPIAGSLYPHVAAPLLQSLVVLARVAGTDQLLCDELLLMQVQKISETCPNQQVAALCGELVGYLLK